MILDLFIYFIICRVTLRFGFERPILVNSKLFVHLIIIGNRTLVNVHYIHATNPQPNPNTTLRL